MIIKKKYKMMNKKITDIPQLIEEWHPTRNTMLNPDEITCVSSKKVWWYGRCGHEWDAVISKRYIGQGCPYCAGRRILAGYNDLESQNPELAKEWHPEKNGDKKPSDVGAGSTSKYWWLGKCGHEWESSIHNRSYGNGCPYCANRVVLIGFNDLQSKYPDLAKEWHPTKNKDRTPQNTVFGSNANVWWECEKGHEWRAKITDRIRRNSCPVCAGEAHTSFPEQAIFYYVKKYFPDTINRYKDRKNNISEIDIFIPSLMVGIEYDGCYYHSNKEKDLKKNLILAEAGIKLYRIVEENGIDECDYKKEGLVYAYKPYRRNTDVLDSIIIDVLIGLGCIVDNNDINIKRDHSIILEQYVLSEKMNSFQMEYPDIAKEWHPIKNGKLRPDNVSSNSEKLIWWQCAKGHEWQARVCHRSRGHGCIFCTNQKVLAGFNDLLTINPILASEWNYKKNKGLHPSMFLPNSKKKVAWICKNGHEWDAQICSRNQGRGCPYCAGKKAIIGVNDIVSISPYWLKEWDYSKNEILPDGLLPNSHMHVWWKCEICGNSWSATIADRNRGNGCRRCAGNLPKRVQNVETGAIFESCAQAAQLYAGAAAGVSACCRGKQKTAYGFHWRFVDGEV